MTDAERIQAAADYAEQVRAGVVLSTHNLAAFLDETAAELARVTTENERLKSRRWSNNNAREVAERGHEAALARDFEQRDQIKSLKEQLARVTAERDEAFEAGYDRGQTHIWAELVCSDCGKNHDRDESAMCEGGDVVEFAVWVDAAEARAARLEAALRKIVHQGDRQHYDGVQLHEIAREALGSGREE